MTFRSYVSAEAKKHNNGHDEDCDHAEFARDRPPQTRKRTRTCYMFACIVTAISDVSSLLLYKHHIINMFLHMPFSTCKTNSNRALRRKQRFQRWCERFWDLEWKRILEKIWDMHLFMTVSVCFPVCGWLFPVFIIFYRLLLRYLISVFSLLPGWAA